VVVDLSLKIQQTSPYFELDRKIDLFFPPVRLDTSQSACLQMNFTAFTYFEVKLAYASAGSDADYKERAMFRSIESLGPAFRLWQATITPNVTEGQEFVVVLHSRRSSPGVMAEINSISLLMEACSSTGQNIFSCSDEISYLFNSLSFSGNRLISRVSVTYSTVGWVTITSLVGRRDIPRPTLYAVKPCAIFLKVRALF